MAFLKKDYSQDLIINSQEFKESWINAKKRGLILSFRVLAVPFILFLAIFILTFFIHFFNTLDFLLSVDEMFMFLKSSYLKFLYLFCLFFTSMIVFLTKRKIKIKGKTKGGNFFVKDKYPN